MAKNTYNIFENEMNNGKALVKGESVGESEFNIRGNKLQDVDYIIDQSQEIKIQQLLSDYLISDTPPEKIQEVLTVLKSINDKNADTVYDKLSNIGLKTYLEVGASLTNLAAALLPILS